MRDELGELENLILADKRVHVPYRFPRKDRVVVGIFTYHRMFRVEVDCLVGLDHVTVKGGISASLFFIMRPW